MPAKKTTERPIKTEKAQEFQTVYSNSVQIDQSPWDVRLRMGQIQAATQEEVVVSELVYVYMSPQHAKAFSEILSQVVAKWEQRHGTIPPLSAEEVAKTEH